MSSTRVREQTSSERRILECAIAELVTLDESDDAISYHRIAGYLVRHALSLEVEKRQGRALEAQALADGDAVRVVDLALAQLHRAGASGLLLKGNTVAALLGESWRRRPSSDIDVANFNQGQTEGLGYTSSPSICHELATLHGANLVPIDVHRYYPVWSTSSSSYPTATRITSADLDLNSAPLTSTPSFRIVSRENAALVIAAHMFRSLVEHPAFSRLKLIELLEYHALTRSSSFSRVAFEEQARDSGALQSVNFADTILQRIIDGDRSPVAIRAELFRGTLVPIELPAISIFSVGAIFKSMDLRSVEGSLGVAKLDVPAQIEVFSGAQHVSSASLRAVVIARHNDSSEILIEAELSSVDYKSEVRLTSSTGTWRIYWYAGSSEYQVDHDGKPDVFVMTEVRLTADVLSARILANSGDELILLSAHRFKSRLTQDWNEFYANGLDSLALLVRLRSGY